MKKSLILFLMLVFLMAGFVLAECKLNVELVNQDPYPAVPGDYVKLLFQVSGVQGPDCGEVSLELVENYPLKFDPGFDPVKTFNSGTFARGFSSNWAVPYTVRIDSEALDGDTEIEVLYSTKGSSSFKVSNLFNLRIEQVKADLQVLIRSYNYANNRLSLDVLNTAKNPLRSLVISIPSQETIRIFGGNQNIIGDLDSNDYTSTDFQAIPQDGTILVDLEYTDKTGERRQTQTEIVFDSEYFQHTIPDTSGQTRNIIIAVVVILAIIVWVVLKKKKKKLIK